MELQQLRCLLGFLPLLLACSSNEQTCTATYLDGIYVGDQYDHVCTNALVFAARDTAGLIPEPGEIVRYYDRLRRAARAEPVLGRVGPPLLHRGLVPGYATILTRNQRVIDAWGGTGGPATTTGDEAFDTLLSNFPHAYVWSRYELGSGEIQYEVELTTIYNEEALNEKLLVTDSRLPEYADGLGYPDAIWRWQEADGTAHDGATAEIDYLIGWGDCIAGCRFFHRLLAISPPTGLASVFDLGGDPLPPELELAPATQPP
ncbi:MAG TPA: hypothetical protein VFQ53_33650 [Kofleriaceae bacterium]|nr:hypothetical protein [Kofleriaceae bacterium]